MAWGRLRALLLKVMAARNFWKPFSDFRIILVAAGTPPSPVPDPAAWRGKGCRVPPRQPFSLHHRPYVQGME